METEDKNIQSPPMLPEQNTEKRSFTERHSISIKALVVGVLTLLLLIPLLMIQGLIRERKQTKSAAVAEITSKWSGEQIITGPCIAIPYIQELETENKREVVQKNLLLLPETLNVESNVKVEKRRRGIYDASVYRSDIFLSGEFNLDELRKSRIKPERIKWEEARVIFGISDLKGVRESVVLEIEDKTLNFEPGIPVENLYTNGTPSISKYNYEFEETVLFPNVSSGIFGAGLNAKLDSLSLFTQEKIPFSVSLLLNGSQGLYIVPVGKTTVAAFTSDWKTPGFGGEFLPETHEITDSGFSAKWKVLDLNRSFSQVVGADHAGDMNQMASSVFGVKFIQPVDQYQQNLRSVKYAILIIMLTFVVVFFIELLQKKSVNPLHYLLVGLALVLFYSLLLSMSEVWGFNFAYLIAAVMTTILITLHMAGILKNRRQGLLVGILLIFLYLFIFILIRMESYALLVGSVGLFVILGVIMYYSKKIKFG
jgi:Inner membrane protein involved in colicin E2 resistance